MNIKTLFILASLILCGCDKSEPVNEEESTPEPIVSSNIETTPVSFSLSQEATQTSQSDVISEAAQFLIEHDNADSTQPTKEDVSPTTTTSDDDHTAQAQCGENGDFFVGLEQSNDCSDDFVNDTEHKSTPVNSQSNAICYFNKNTIRGAKLKTSKWEAIGHIQNALKIKVDGVFGADTKAALSKELNISDLKCITNEQYTKLTKQKPDTLRQKAANFSFMMEGTDYDTLEFNYPYDKDDHSGATWGPTGMTLRSGEISAIFKLALKSDEFTKAISSQELSLVKELSETSGSQAKALVKRLVWNKGSSARQKFKDFFKRIAAIKAVRVAFDQVSDLSIQDKLKFYESYLQKHDNVSELDWAMFFDISVQTGKPEKKLKALLSQAPPNSISDPAKRRTAWAKIISKQVHSKWEEDRLKRSMLFVGKDSLARAYGLNDNPAKID